jgi:glycosyltransferase involved in cell wall biosynthesis
MTKTIAFFNGFYLPHLGGVENYTYHLARQLISHGFRVLVITAQYDPQLPMEEESKEGIEIYRLPIYQLWRSRYPFLKKNKDYRGLLKKIKSRPIDVFVVNTRFYQTSQLGVKMAAQAGKRALLIEHGSAYLSLGVSALDNMLHPIERYLTRKILNYEPRFYGVSAQAAGWLKEFGIIASGVLYNAIDSADYQKYHTETFNHKVKIFYAGRLLPKIKGIEKLLAVFLRLKQEQAPIELTIAGDGPLLKYLRENYLSSDIHILGKLPHAEILKLDDQSDIFVLMSRSEGFSTAILEAALLENVIITTDVGGARELIPDTNVGFVIPDTEAALYQTLKQLITDKGSMIALKKAISERVLKQFSWETTTTHLVEEIEKLKLSEKMV